MSAHRRTWRSRLVAGVVGLSGWLVGCSSPAGSADTPENAPAGMAEFDPRLADLEYPVRAGEVRDKTGTTAAGVLDQLPIEGMPAPDDLSDETRAALDAMAAC